MRLLATLLFLLLPLPSMAQEVQLLMGEAKGCYWCAQWNREIGGIYPKTAQGKQAPLLRVDIHDPLPQGVTLDSGLRYTPTFVLLVDGQEQGRIEGYPGEDFFWGLLGMLFDRAGIAVPEGA